MKNILLHAGSYDRPGGTNEFVRRAAEYFSKKKEVGKVIVMSHRLKKDLYKNRDISDKIKVIYFPAFPRKKFAILFYAWRFLLMCFKILNVTLKHKINNVVVGETEALCYFPLRFFGVKILLRAGTFAQITKEEMWKEQGRNKLKEFLIDLYQKVVLTFPNKIIARSVWERGNLKELTKRKILLIKYSVDQKVFFPATKQSKNKNLVYVGRIAKIKRIGTLVKLFNKIRRKVKTQLILVGKIDIFESEKKLRELSSFPKDIIFLGQKEHNEVAKILREGYIFAHTSPDAGNTLTEAAACRLPVMTLGENFKGLDYCIYNPDEKVFVRKAINLLKDKKDYLKESKRALDEIQKSHNIRNLDKYLKLME